MRRPAIDPTVELIVYVPDPADPIGEIYVQDLAPGCAIVGAATSPQQHEHAPVYIEANRSRSSNIITFADRVLHASEALLHRMRTNSQRTLPANALRAVGTFVVATRTMKVTDETSLARWLGMPDDKVPPHELETQSKAPVDPEHLIHRFCAEVPDGVVASVHGWRPDGEHDGAQVARGYFGQFSYEDARGGLMVAGSDDGRAFAFYLLAGGWQMLAPDPWPFGIWLRWSARDGGPDTLARCRTRDLTMWQFATPEAQNAFLAANLPVA